MTVAFSLLTPPGPGAIAVLQLVGVVDPLLERLADEAGRSTTWVAGRPRLLEIGDIDEVVIVRLDARRAIIMPHGGPRIVRRLMEHLAEHGAIIDEPTWQDPEDLFPEAADRIEALMLLTLARCESPLGVDLLLDQPRRWQAHRASGLPLTEEDRTRSQRLNRLLRPLHLVLLGPPNVGKSTLTNLLAGREVAITADLPGTTRDAVWCRLELAGLVVDWSDTPGVRDAADPLEREAVRLAALLVSACDLVIAVTDAFHDWPALATPTRQPVLWMASRCDLGRRDDVELQVSAATGEGVSELVAAIREKLVPQADLDHPGVWIFDRRLLGA